MWPDLHQYVGADWEDVEIRLLSLIEQYSNATDTSSRIERQVDLLSFIGIYPTLAKRMEQMLLIEEHLTTHSPSQQGNIHESLQYLRESIEFTSPWPGEQTVIRHTDTSQERNRIIRYTDISCPDRVSINTPRLSIIVRLTVSPPLNSDSLTELQVESSLPVLVRIDAPAFTILGKWEQEITLLPDADSSPIVFDIQPTKSGPASITFDFFQGGHALSTTSVIVEVVDANDNSMPPQQHGSQLTISPPRINPPDFMLYITYEQWQEQPTLYFELRPLGGVGRRFPPMRLSADPAQYAANIYRRLTALAMQIDPTVEALGNTLRLDPEDIEQRLQEECQNLWRDLIPEELKVLYAQERQAWRDRSILFITDEPYLPWELLWPYGDDWVDEEPLCLTSRFSRWLRREARQGRANDEPRTIFSLQSLGLIVPPDTGLPAVQQEQQIISHFANQANVRLIQPRPRRRDVIELLSHGTYDWLHVATHGNFHPDDPDRESAIWLEGGEPLTSQTIVGRIEMSLRLQRPAIIFNACEVGRPGRSLTGIGGWANRFVSAGAGLFLAPMWVVNDEPAQIFAELFYTALGSGHSVAEACRYARRGARTTGDLTWLAYSLYAHPNAIIERGTD